MITKIYFLFIAIIYGGFGVWCSLSPRKTAAAIGYELKNAAGLTEYLAVYGGLELGMAVFFAIAAFHKPFAPAALVMAVAVHALIALVRLAGATTQGYWSPVLVGLLVVEAGIAIAGGLLLRGRA